MIIPGLEALRDHGVDLRARLSRQSHLRIGEIERQQRARALGIPTHRKEIARPAADDAAECIRALLRNRVTCLVERPNGRLAAQVFGRRAQRQLDLELARQKRVLRRVCEAFSVAAGRLRVACRRQRGHQDDRRPGTMCATHVALLRQPATAGGSQTQKLVDLHHEAAVLQRRQVGDGCVAAFGVDDEELAAGHVFPAEAHVRG